MAALVVDLTDIDRVEFELLRTMFPIVDGEPVPARKSVIKALLINAGMLGLVLKDPAMKPKLGMEGLEAPRRHQRKIVGACMSLVRKLERYRYDRYLLLMNLVGLSNRLFEEQGDPGVIRVFETFKAPIKIDSEFLVPSKPADPENCQMLEATDRLAREINSVFPDAPSL